MYLFCRVKSVFDRWAAASAALRQNLLTLTNNDPNTTVVRIEAEGAHKTVITMMGAAAGSPAAAPGGSSGFRLLEECMAWVDGRLVSDVALRVFFFNSMPRFVVSPMLKPRFSICC